MSRRKAREVALQALFQLDYNEIEKQDALESVLAEREKISEPAKEYASHLLEGTKQNLPEIDRLITSLSSEWKVDRMAGVDRNIARIAIYEMNFNDEQLPPNIVINEAVELAKLYGSEESSRFINGILGSLVRKKQQQ